MAASKRRFHFVSNLRPGTVEIFDAVGYVPAAWLLSSHRLTPRTRDLAAAVRGAGGELMADNGTTALISRVVDIFAAELRPLRAEFQRLRKSLGRNRRTPLPSEVPAPLADAARAAAYRVADEVDRLVRAQPLEGVLAAQLLMRPTQLIAKEDFTAAALTSLGLEREYTGLPVAFFNRRNRISLDYWSQVANDARCRGIEVFATIGAMDYATARAGARQAAEAGVRHVALGFAGINRDRTAVELFRKVRRTPLSEGAPRRYVRAAEIAYGIRDGYREAGVRLRSFHALGAGSRAQFPILAAAFDWYTTISADATSPVMDAAWDGVVYDERFWGDRVHVVEGARSVVRGGTWPHTSPFARALRREFGYRPSAARRWWSQNSRPQVTIDDLHPQERPGQWLPIFATAKGSAAAPHGRARIGHNHWVVDRLAEAIPNSRRRAWALRKMSELETTRSGPSRLGVQAGLQIASAMGD